MAHLICKCGEDMWNGLVPNDIQFWVYSDRQMDTIMEQDTISALDFGLQDKYCVWRCPKCKRLYVFDGQENSSQVKYIYRLEESDTQE